VLGFHAWTGFGAVTVDQTRELKIIFESSMYLTLYIMGPYELHQLASCGSSQMTKSLYPLPFPCCFSFFKVRVVFDVAVRTASPAPEHLAHLNKSPLHASISPLRNALTFSPHTTCLLYTAIPGTLPSLKPSIASASISPLPSSRSSLIGY
jgi:hypothetical protein